MRPVEQIGSSACLAPRSEPRNQAEGQDDVYFREETTFAIFGVEAITRYAPVQKPTLGSCPTHAIEEIFGVEWPRHEGKLDAVIWHDGPTLYKVRRHASVHGERLQQGYPGNNVYHGGPYHAKRAHPNRCYHYLLGFRRGQTI